MKGAWLGHQAPRPLRRRCLSAVSDPLLDPDLHFFSYPSHPTSSKPYPRGVWTRHSCARPLLAQKRTFSALADWSQKCHVWTAPSWQGESSRRVAGRCSHVFGLLARHTGPLAIMPSADQVPVKSSHSTMHWHMWVVLIAGSTGSALRAVRPPNLHITPDSRRDLVHAASATGSL